MNRIIKNLVDETIEDVRFELFQMYTLPSVKKYNSINIESIEDLKNYEFIPMKKRRNRKVKMYVNPLKKIKA